GKAKKIYCRIVRDGKATAGELLQRMMIYAAAREGQDERFTKTPAKWLENECWRDDPKAISPKNRWHEAHQELKERVDAWKSGEGNGTPSKANRHQDQTRDAEQEFARQLRARRTEIDKCKDRCRTGYRSGPHWFQDNNYAVYREALAELAIESLPEERAADFRRCLPSATHEELCALKTEIEQALNPSAVKAAG